MILAWLILILLIGGVAAWIAGRWSDRAAWWIGLIASLIDLALVVGLWGGLAAQARLAPGGPWLIEWSLPWIPALGIGLHLAIDGLSLLLLVLTMFFAVVSVLVSWGEIRERVGFHVFNLLWVLAGIAGVFMALDLFLFYFFWELMLIPMTLLIVVWGYERRVYAAIKFFLFTQLSGLFMLISIIALFFIHGAGTGVYTFDYTALLGTPINEYTQAWLMAGFFVAFAVKLPVVPLHNWLPDAHTEAPTAGSVILAGLLLKTGGYGLFRFVLPLFPQASMAFAPWAMMLAVFGILYGAIMAFGQTDLKRMVAYTSVSHMGFVLLGVFAFNTLALQGAVMEMIAHAFSTGALFIIVGGIMHRIHTRDMHRMGGFWTVAPRMGGIALFFALASLGLPGLGNFIAEFLTLVGAFPVNTPMTALAALGLVAGAIYSLWIIQRVFYGKVREEHRFADLSLRETAVLGSMIVILLWLGLFPRPVLETTRPSMARLEAPALLQSSRPHPPPVGTAPRPGQGSVQ